MSDKGSRINGKNWKEDKSAFRIKKLGVKNKKFTSFQLRNERDLQEKDYKTKVKELKEEKESARKSKLEESKRRKDLKEEKERYEKLAEKMNKRKVERLRRKEKRNKLLKER